MQDVAARDALEADAVHLPVSSVPSTGNPVAKPHAEPRTDDDEDRWTVMIDELAEESRYLLRKRFPFLDEVRASAASANSASPLETINRADIPALLLNCNLPPSHRIAMFSFLGRLKRSSWMHRQKHYVERIAIGLGALWQHGLHMALCGVHGRFCQQPDYCPQCALMLRAKPAVREYGASFPRARFWYAHSPSFETNPRRAGLHFVVEKRDVNARTMGRILRFNPYQAGPVAEPLTADDDLGETNPVAACFRSVFGFADALAKASRGGVFAHRELAWHFLPHRITPHGHLLFCPSEPLTFEVARNLLRLFQQIYADQPFGRRLYCDLHIEQLLRQKDVNNWVYYTFKPMDYVTGYLRAASTPGADIPRLNQEIDDRIFQGGAVILRSCRSPRRYGVLRCNSAGYIGGGSVTAWRKQNREKKRSTTFRPHQLSNVHREIHDAVLELDLPGNEDL